MFDYSICFRSGICFLRVKGVLDKNTSSSLNSYLIPLIIKNGIKYLVYNLHDLKSIDGVGCTALKECETAIKFNDGEIIFCNIPCNLKIDNEIKNRETRDELTALRILGGYNG